MRLQELRFGVEIETIKRSRGDVARAIQTVVGGNAEHVGSPSCYDPWHVVDEQGRTWMVVADSSLTNVPANLRAEVVSPVLNYEDIQPDGPGFAIPGPVPRVCDPAHCHPPIPVLLTHSVLATAPSAEETS